MKDFMNKIIPIWLWIALISVLIFAFVSRAMGQDASPTYNPLNSGFQNNFQFPNNTNHPSNFHRPNNFEFQSGRLTLYADSKSGKMQPWVRKNLR